MCIIHNFFRIEKNICLRPGFNASDLKPKLLTIGTNIKHNALSIIFPLLLIPEYFLHWPLADCQRYGDDTTLGYNCTDLTAMAQCTASLPSTN